MTTNPFWTILPTLLWICFLGAVAFFFRKEVRSLLWALLGRIQHGASMKVAGVEIGSSVALPNQVLKSDHSKAARQDEGRRKLERDEYYASARRVMLVHRLFPSTEPGQVYEILIYLVPARSATLAGVERVEYFFGGHGWNNRVFTARDRSQGFPILTAAYGPFLCSAEVFFTDGQSFMLHRFIDFEMGSLASLRSYE
jgi:hypothetical protein